MKLREYIATTLRGYLDEQQEVKKLYHGSNAEFDQFDDSKISSGDGSEMFGEGYYLTDNLDVANFYAKLVTKKEKIIKYEPTGIFKTLEPKYSKDADAHAETNKKINTFRLNGNILDSDALILDEKFLNLIKDSFIRNSGWGKEGEKIFNGTIEFLRNNKDKIHGYRGELIYIFHQLVSGDKEIKNDIITYIKRLGYDGIKYRPDRDFEGNENSYNYVIYNKNVLTKI